MRCNRIKQLGEALKDLNQEMEDASILDIVYRELAEVLYERKSQQLNKRIMTAAQKQIIEKYPEISRISLNIERHPDGRKTIRIWGFRGPSYQKQSPDGSTPGPTRDVIYNLGTGCTHCSHIHGEVARQSLYREQQYQKISQITEQQVQEGIEALHEAEKVYNDTVNSIGNKVPLYLIRS